MSSLAPYYALPLCFCVSLLSKVSTGALNFEFLTHIYSAIYTIKYLSVKSVHITIALLEQAFEES